jgi:hypothetical protein
MRSPIKKIQTGGNYADKMRSVVAPQAAMGSAGVGPMAPPGGRRMKQGGDVQSESSKLDQKNAEMDKAQEEGYKRYLTDQEQKKKENIESRKTMPMLRFGLDMLRGDSKEQKEQKKAKGGAIKSSASSRGDGIASKGKTRGRIV